MNLLTLIVLNLFQIGYVLTTYTDSFNEELMLKPLYGNQIYAHFHFKTTWDIDSKKDSGKNVAQFFI